MSNILSLKICCKIVVDFVYYKRADEIPLMTRTCDSDKKVQLQRVTWEKVYEKASVIGSFLTKFYFLFQEQKKKIKTLFCGILFHRVIIVRDLQS